MENLDKEFKKLVKQTKKRRRWVGVGISLLATGVVVVGAVFARNVYVKQALEQEAVKANIAYETQNPNVITNVTGQTLGFLGGSYTTENYKNVDGYLVSIGGNTVSYGQMLGENKDTYNGGTWLSSSVNSNIGDGVFFKNGQKQPSFYSPTAENNYLLNGGKGAPQELRTLTKLPNHLAEVAITFDKVYTYKEIQRMIPQNLLINWCLLATDDKTANIGGSNLYIGLSTNVDNYSKGEPSYDEATGKLNSQDERKILGATTTNTIYGLDDKLYGDFVAAIKKANTISDFTALGFGSGTGPDDVKMYYPYREALKQVKQHPTLATAKFAGVILTGRTENFAQLSEKSWIYASSVGATTEVLPYLEPIT